MALCARFCSLWSFSLKCPLMPSHTALQYSKWGLMSWTVNLYSGVCGYEWSKVFRGANARGYLFRCFINILFPWQVVIYVYTEWFCLFDLFDNISLNLNFQWLFWISNLWREPININSVLAIFKCSLFAMSHQFHLLISSFISASSIVICDAARLILVSSAYILGVALLKQLGRSLIYIKKSNGSKIDPRGTPQVIWFGLDIYPLNITPYIVFLTSFESAKFVFHVITMKGGNIKYTSKSWWHQVHQWKVVTLSSTPVKGGNIKYTSERW